MMVGRSDRFTEAFRREVFLALVTAQDGGTPVVQSRLAVAADFGLREADVMRIEREGLEAGWPPLD
jgi:hypothetical protein